MLGLYFGVTVITLYETIFFFLSEPDYGNLNPMPQKKFSKKTLYESEYTEDELAIPRY